MEQLSGIQTESATSRGRLVTILSMGSENTLNIMILTRYRYGDIFIKTLNMRRAKVTSNPNKGLYQSNTTDTHHSKFHKFDQVQFFVAVTIILEWPIVET